MLVRRFPISLSNYFLATLMLISTGTISVLAQTPENFKIALFGDQGLDGIDDSRAIDVLNLIKREGAQAVVHAGDFEYQDDPQAWEDQINGVLGADFPYFAVVGNHDELAYESAPDGGPGYKFFMEERMNRLGISWSGIYGIKSTHYYQGIFFVLTTPGSPELGGGTNIEQGDYIRDQLAMDNSIWSISSWHHNVREMQVGGKGNAAGWPVYEESRKGGGIIITGHEHSYSRTHLLSDMENQVIASTEDTLVIQNDYQQTTNEDEGRTFTTVSGIGGQQPRPQSQPSDDYWASIYTRTQDAKVGSLFAEFNYQGDPYLAHFYFMNVDNEIIDEFWVRSNVDWFLPKNNPPSAIAMASTNSGNTPLLVDFTGENSTDTDGSIVDYQWDFGDGNTSDLPNPSHTFSSAGTYTVSLTVTDDDGATDATELTITAVERPVASFSYIADNLKVDFTDNSTDDGTLVSWAWDFGDGSVSDMANPTHSYMSAGAYTVSLTVTDNEGATDLVQQTVAVVAAPVAGFNFTVDELQVDFTDTSTDDGTVVGWAWDFGDGSVSDMANPTHSYMSAGTYTVSLTVTDNEGATDMVQQTVAVVAAPVAGFNFTVDELQVNFTDTSTDDGTLVGWAWDFGDGSMSDMANPTHSYMSAGTYTVSLTVTDNEGATDMAQQSVSVISSPVADFTYTSQGFLFNFVDASTDDGTVVDWAWDFGDGNQSDMANPSHTYMTADSYTVNLTVTDNEGGTNSTQQLISVSASPVASFTYVADGLLVDFMDTSSDDGTIVDWSWDFGDGTGADVANPIHVFTEVGTYTVRLTVTDDSGNTHTQEAIINVEIVLSLNNPEVFSLSHNYPNPFSTATTIVFALPQKSDVLLEVFDLMGRRISILADGEFDTGHYEVTWNLHTANELSSGIYLYRLRAGSFDAIRRMVLIK